MRNFWIEATIDGKQTKLASGPRAKDGGFMMKVYQRDEGQSVTACEVIGAVDETGELCLTVYDECDVVIHQFYTER